MKKGTQIFIYGSVDVLSTFVIICWLLSISQLYNSIQWIIIVLGWIVLFSKILFWDRMLKNYVKKYIHPEVPIRIGDTTFDIKVESEGEK